MPDLLIGPCIHICEFVCTPFVSNCGSHRLQTLVVSIFAYCFPMAFHGNEPEFDLQGEEASVLQVDAFAPTPEAEKDVWLVGRVLCNHFVGILSFKNCMRELWVSRNCVEIRHAGQKNFTIKFSSTKDRELVLKSGPWFF